jgi:hypothetical protein
LCARGIDFAFVAMIFIFVLEVLILPKQIYHSGEKVPNSTRKIVETKAKSIPLEQIGKS